MNRIVQGLGCLLCGLLASCDNLTDPGVCTLAGCSSGLEIVLEDPPEAPYLIEASAQPDESAHVFECSNESGCTGPVFFQDFTPLQVYIEVITEAGTERFEVVPTYQEFRPNGSRCPPLCRRGVVHLPSDLPGG
jgi:hypothetical protein